ncbi:MAG: molybdopterin converting factor [Gemmatimonadetes bacterium]|nr:molybdopterin converting factor [Gemmatimonadota bacterium]
MRTAIVDEPIDTAALVAEVGRHANGATLLFVGTVREVNDGRAVSGMEYKAYRSMAERELADIAREARAEFGTDDVVVEHRLGTLGLGEASVAIAVAHAHRGAAYDASRYVIEQLKKRVPIWKLEHYVDGSREWVGAASASAASTAKEP